MVTYSNVTGTHLFLFLFSRKWFRMNDIQQIIPESELCFCFLFGIQIRTALRLSLQYNLKRVKGALAVGKRTLVPRRAVGKKHPVSPGAAYRAASTISELPYWRREVILQEDSLEICKMLLILVKTGREIRSGWPALLLPPDDYGCGLGCECFTGTLSAFEEHERICHWLGLFLPEELAHNLLNGNEDKLALPFLKSLSQSSTRFPCCNRPTKTRLTLCCSSFLMRSCRWSPPIETQHLCRSYQHQNTRLHLQRPLQHPFFRLL